MFTDKVTIHVKAGRGGDGRVSFRRNRGQAKGGPDGGDGGRGGNVLLHTNHNTSTLSKYRVDQLHRAEDGTSGGSNRRSGKQGQDIILEVPPGTVVYENGELVADLTMEDSSQTVAQGGIGGFGNAHFTSSTRQAPKMAELGTPGEEKELVLELKLLADVGLVGLPNAGKSTLLSVISNAKPEIADYPFTTLTPNLGVVDFHNHTFLVADIPGLIEGAAEGKGLGDEFLRHIERTKVLLHLIDGNDDDLALAYQTICRELKDYQIDLSTKPQLVVLTKIDSLSPEALKTKLGQMNELVGQNQEKSKVLAISAVAKKGLDTLLNSTQSLIDQSVPSQDETETEPVVISLEGQDNVWRVEPRDDIFVIKGLKLERFAQKTNFDQFEAVERLRDILSREGVLREVKRLGGDRGSRLEIAGKVFEW